MSDQSSLNINDIVKQYKANVVNYLSYKLKISREDAEEITMDTFLRINDILHKYDPQYAFVSWLYRIAFNRAIDFLRRRKNKPETINFDDVPVGIVDIGIKDNYKINCRELKVKNDKMIRNIIYSLPLKYKNVMILRVYRGLTMDEIAKFMDVPCVSIRIRAHRAKQMIKEKLAVCQYF